MFDSLCTGTLVELCNFIATFLIAILLIAAALLIGAIILLMLAARDIRKVTIPPDADFFETMRLIPITIPIAMDVLDLVFDTIIPGVGGIIGAPISWMILESLGLKSLRLFTAAESLIPGTQLIPTLTGGWIIARMFKSAGSSSTAQTRYYERPKRTRRSSAASLPEWTSDEPKLLDEPQAIDEEDF